MNKVRSRYDKKHPVTDEERDSFFDEWLMPGGASLRAVATWIVNEIESEETRQRARRRDDLEGHKELIGTIVANIARAFLLRPDKPTLAVITSHNEGRRYNRPQMRQLPRALRLLEERDLIEHLPPSRIGFAGIINPHRQFVEELRGAKVSFADIARHPDEEILKLTWSRYESGDKRLDPLPIPVTPKVAALRWQVRELNGFLARADITIKGGAEAERIDNYDRRLHRHFTVLKRDEETRWDLNGRLFGGFWMTLPKAKRHLIRINGKKLADLDFQNLFVRLAYCKLGVEPPKGDLYADLGFDERYRGGVKKLVSSFLFARKRRSKIPEGITSELPEGLTVKAARGALLSAHPQLESLIETGVGYSLMHTESEILVACLEGLFSKGIPALPMHDGLMAERSRAREAKSVMLAKAVKVSGFELPVVVKRMEEASEHPFRREN